ncbi:MAG: hypothetical protein VYE34_07250, partial [Pseudomonadota bacterium]|nr:hypothetical protein [Pseudomonadota bacterium]
FNLCQRMRLGSMGKERDLLAYTLTALHLSEDTTCYDGAFTCPPPLVPLARLVLLLAFSLVAGTALAQSAPRVELASVNGEPIYQELNLVGTVNSLEDAQLSSSVAGLVAGIKKNAATHRWPRLSPNNSMFRKQRSGQATPGGRHPHSRIRRR